MFGKIAERGLEAPELEVGVDDDNDDRSLAIFVVPEKEDVEEELMLLPLVSILFVDDEV